MGILDGRTAIVTGAGQGVGKGIAIALAKEGAAVCVAEINPESGQATAKELEALGVKAEFMACDVAALSAVETLVDTVVENFGGLDILVNNATGTRPEDASIPALKHTLEQFDRILGVDIKGSFSFMKAAHPHLKASSYGRIINLTSCAGTERGAGFAAYATAKEGLRALTGVVAREWGRDGITANCLCPVAASPSLLEWHEENPELKKSHLATIPMGRLGDPETDIGRVVAFLASDAGGYITGQTLWAEGGQTIHA